MPRSLIPLLVTALMVATGCAHRSATSPPPGDLSKVVLELSRKVGSISESQAALGNQVELLRTAQLSTQDSVKESLARHRENMRQTRSDFGKLDQRLRVVEEKLARLDPSPSPVGRNLDPIIKQQYNNRNYQSVIQTYEQSSPADTVGPASLLFVETSYGQLHKDDRRRPVLERLIQQFPTSPQVAVAKNRLSTLP